jgi:hypothetical protein
MAIQHVAAAGDTRATMEAIADGLEVRRREPLTRQHLAQQRPGDAWGRLEGDNNA